MNALISSYRCKAVERGLVWDLTSLDAKRLFKGSCSYCGELPNQIKRMRGLRGDFIYNGIDRKDNSVGYTFDNSVSCCGECNRMKGTLSDTNFLLRISRIYHTATRLGEDK